METWGAGDWEKGAHGSRMSNQSPPPPPSPTRPFPTLIISGSASLLVLGYFYSFLHLHENSSGVNRRRCVSEYAQTIEEEKRGIWVQSRWKLEQENPGISEVLSHMFPNQVFLLDKM